MAGRQFKRYRTVGIVPLPDFAHVPRERIAALKNQSIPHCCGISGAPNDKSNMPEKTPPQNVVLTILSS
jgi:hypothetical protein